MTCRSSHHAHVRFLEETFYDRASRGVDDAIGKDERLFDAMRAATLLAPWLYGRGRYPEVSPA